MGACVETAFSAGRPGRQGSSCCEQMSLAGTSPRIFQVTEPWELRPPGIATPALSLPSAPFPEEVPECLCKTGLGQQSRWKEGLGSCLRTTLPFLLCHATGLLGLPRVGCEHEDMEGLQSLQPPTATPLAPPISQLEITYPFRNTLHQVSLHPTSFPQHSNSQSHTRRWAVECLPRIFFKVHRDTNCKFSYCLKGLRPGG